MISRLMPFLCSEMKEIWFKKKIFYLSFFLTSNLMCSQDIFKEIATPNAAEMTRVNANEVNLFTGAPQIAIPIENFDVDGYKFNLALQYNAGGIKVSQKSTNVGLGWHLSAGGSIVRHLKGEPDENYVYIHTAGSVTKKGWLQGSTNVRDLNLFNFHNVPNHGAWKQLLDPFFITGIDYSYLKDVDTEPDIFEFNFNGKSGKFVFDNVNGVISVHQVPWQGLKIEYKIKQQVVSGLSYYDFESFTITDTDNTKYFFETFEETNHRSAVFDMYPHNGWERQGGEFLRHYRSSWHLTKVITSNLKTITFEYEQEMIHFLPVGMQAAGEHYKERFSTDVFYIVNNQDITMVLKTLSKVRLPNTIVEFKTEQNKLAIDHNRANSLQEINIYNSLEGKLIKKIGFDYGFSESEGIETAETRYKHNYRRMFLKQIKKYYSPTDLSQFNSYKFYYNLKDFGENTTQKLPQMNSFAVDLWGFYNGANQNTSLIPKMYIYPSIPGSDGYRVEKLNNFSGTEFVFNGADRIPNGSFMGVGMLNKIVHPTGGSTVFEYEPNSYLDRNETYLGPGLRIKKMTLNDGKKDEAFFYEYKDKNGKTSGRITAIPIMARILAHLSGLPQYNLDYYTESLVRYSDTQSELSTIDTRLIGYNTVSEIRPGNGRTVSMFSNNGTVGNGTDIHVDDDGPCSNPYSIGYCDGLFEPAQIFHLPYGTHTTGVELSAFSLDLPVKNTFPFPPSPNYDWNRGLLLSRETYNEENQKLHRKINIYQNYTPGLNHSTKQPYNIYGLKMEEVILGRPNETLLYPNTPKSGVSFRASKYKIITDIVKVVSATIDSTFYPSSNSVPNIKRIDYTYNSRFHNFPSKISSRNSKNEETVTEYSFPSDLWNDADPEAAIFEEMENRNMLSNPIIIRQKVNNNYVEEIYNHYGIFNNLILKSAEYSKKGRDINVNSSTDRKIKYDRYDTDGNLLQYSVENKSTTAIIWGYNNMYPVLKVEGATYTEVMSKISSTLNEEIYDGTLSPHSLAFLRDSLPNALVNIYTYIPLIGIQSITDPKGNTVFYTYDTYGRLNTVKDMEGNLLSENKYHYKN